jgi:hypothetical protein
MFILPKQLHIVKSRFRDNQVLGHGSQVFGFKNKVDAMKIHRIINHEKEIIIWNTIVKPNKFMIFTPKNNQRLTSIVTTELTENIIDEYTFSLLSVRIIDSIEKENVNEDINVYSLFSEHAVFKDVTHDEFVFACEMLLME